MSKKTNSVFSDMSSALESVTERFIHTFILQVGEKTGADVKNLKEMWTEISNGNFGESGKTFPPSPTGSTNSNDSKTSEVSRMSKTSKVSVTSVSGCPHKFSKGAKEGTTCGVKPKNGQTYCSTHKKFEGKTPKEKKIVPEPKKTFKVKKTKKTPEVRLDRTLRRHTLLNKYWHPDTGFVFDSPENKVVVGFCKEDKILDLDADQIEECKRLSFNLDPKYLTETPEEKRVVVYLTAPSSSGGKFWAGKVEGNTFSLNYGKIGCEGTSSSKDFDTHAEALNELNSSKEKKLKKGYTEEEPVRPVKDGVKKTVGNGDDNEEEEVEKPEKKKKTKKEPVEEKNEEVVEEVQTKPEKKKKTKKEVVVEEEEEEVQTKPEKKKKTKKEPVVEEEVEEEEVQTKPEKKKKTKKEPVEEKNEEVVEEVQTKPEKNKKTKKEPVEEKNEEVVGEVQTKPEKNKKTKKEPVEEKNEEVVEEVQTKPEKKKKTKKEEVEPKSDGKKSLTKDFEDAVVEENEEEGNFAPEAMGVLSDEEEEEYILED